MNRPLHLLEVGLRWPPESFLHWKLSGLATRGFRVTVATDGYRDGAGPNNVELVRLPPFPDYLRPTPARRPGSQELARVAAGLVRLGVREPVRLFDLTRSLQTSTMGRRPVKGVRSEAGRLLAFLPLARIRPDVVHFEWEERAIAYFPLVSVWKCPVVISCHGGGINIRPHSPRFERIVSGYPELFSRVDAVHHVSEAIEAEARSYGLEGRRSRVIRPGVDTIFFTPGPRTESDGRFRVLAVASLVWKKGLEYALEAVQMLVAAGVPITLDLVGGQPNGSGDSARIRHAIHDLGLEAHVVLRGNVSSEEVRNRLHQADALLCSSVTEGLPTVLVEALACAVPIVATDCGGVRELVTDGQHGFVVPLREPSALADALRRLWEDPPLRERMGTAGRARVLADFTLEQQLDSFVELYEQLVLEARGAAISSRRS